MVVVEFLLLAGVIQNILLKVIFAYLSTHLPCIRCSRPCPCCVSAMELQSARIRLVRGLLSKDIKDIIEWCWLLFCCIIIFLSSYFALSGYLIVPWPATDWFTDTYSRISSVSSDWGTVSTACFVFFSRRVSQQYAPTYRYHTRPLSLQRRNQSLDTLNGM